MMRGIITTRHILFHPVTLISAWGFRSYIKMLVKCMDHSKHCFADFFLL